MVIGCDSIHSRVRLTAFRWLDLEGTKRESIAGEI